QDGITTSEDIAEDVAGTIEDILRPREDIDSPSKCVVGIADFCAEPIRQRLTRSKPYVFHWLRTKGEERWIGLYIARAPHVLIGVGLRPRFWVEG
ncbi:hypothetical protein AGABI1DRAFT_113781, partial [Agaricus bisporus var. burnettii JB137-S8]